MFECDNDNVDVRDRRDGAADITARRAGACANPIAPEQRAHNDLANSSQHPLRPRLRPDLEFNMQFNLELSLEASSPTSGGSYEHQDLPLERDRRAPGSRCCAGSRATAQSPTAT